MGRLMDSLMAAVGLKPSDRVTITHAPIDTKELSKTKTEPSADNQEQQQTDKSTATPVEQSQSKVSKSAHKSTATLLEQPKRRDINEFLPGLYAGTSINNVSQEVKELKSTQGKREAQKGTGKEKSEDNSEVPAERPDCVGCRVTGLVVGPAVSLFIFHTLYKKHHMYKGAMKYVYIGQGLFLSSALTSLSLARFFEVSLFDPSKSETSLSDLYKEEFKYIGLPVGETDKTQ